MARLLSIFVFCLLYFASKSVGNEEHEEQFTEELLLRPLPDRKVLAHFHFESKAPPTTVYGRHHRLFPKAIYQLLHKFRVQEMELSFTQSRWNYERWGGLDPISSSNAKPPGVELWAVFDVPRHEVDASWKNLTHTLSGLFCASINFLESSTTYSAPDWGFRSLSGNLRYGTLPREAVCTENLTPWLKLLPCRDKAGLSALMDRPSIYRGFYHSQRLHLTSGEFDSAADSGIVLEQTLTIVLQPDTLESGDMFSNGRMLQPSWSMSSLFGRHVDGKCALAKSSNVYVQLEGRLVSELENVAKEHDNSEIELLPSEGWSTLNFELSFPADRVIKEVASLDKESPSILFVFSIENHDNSKTFDLGFRWKHPVAWSCAQAPLHASRFLMGSGNERGAIAISFQSTEWSDSLQNAESFKEICRLRVDVFQVVPWYVKVYYHTIQLFIDGQPQPLGDAIEKMRVSPSEDKVSPGVMELILKLPCVMKSASLTLEFDKGFLHIDEYPPDANQGFDIPSAVVSFPDFQAGLHFLQNDTLDRSPMITKLQSKSEIMSYTEVLLVPLTTPDFSMPYNVITITCTVFALYFGSLLNALRRRAGEEERLLKSKDGKKTRKLPLLLSKLFAKLRGRPCEPPESVPTSSSSSLISRKLIMKVVLVVGIAAGWQYYSE